MTNGISRFSENLNSNPTFQRARLEARGVAPDAAMAAVQPLVQQQQKAQTTGKVQEILQGAHGRELTEYEILQLFSIDPATAEFILEQQKARMPDLQHKINPVTGEEMVIDKKTAQRIDMRGGGGQVIDGEYEDITVPDAPVSDQPLEMPPEIKGNPAAEQKFREAVAQEKGKTAAQNQANRSKLANKLSSSMTQFDDTIRILDDALPNVNNLTAGFASLSASIPGTPASDLREMLQPVLARSGFGTLQEMRDNSPTGGALGQVSDRELSLLQAAEANISTAQSPEQLRKAIQGYREQLVRSKKAIEEAYIKDFGSLPSAGDDLSTKSDAELEEMYRKALEKENGNR